MEVKEEREEIEEYKAGRKGKEVLKKDKVKRKRKNRG